MISQNDADSLVADLVDQPVDRIVPKKSADIILTRDFAVKVRRIGLSTSDVGGSNELAWLRTCCDFDVITHECAINGEDTFVIVMPRLYDEDCAAWKLVNKTFVPECIGSIAAEFVRLGHIVGPRPLTQGELAIRLRGNLQRQIDILSDLPFALLDQVRQRTLAALDDFSSDDMLPRAAHRNAFSPNVFVSDRVVAIDPGLRPGTDMDLPWFGDAATFDVDLLVHGANGRLVLDSVAPTLSASSLSGYLAVVLVKALVRYRFARIEVHLPAQRGSSGTIQDWLAQQNALLVAKLPDLLDALCELSSPLSLAEVRI